MDILLKGKSIDHRDEVRRGSDGNGHLVALALLRRGVDDDDDLLNTRELAGIKQPVQDTPALNLQQRLRKILRQRMEPCSITCRQNNCFHALKKLIPLENVAGVDLVGHIVQTGIVTVGDYCL